MRKFLISALTSVVSLSAVGLASAANPVGGASHGTGAASTNSDGIRSTERNFGKERTGHRIGIKAKEKAVSNSNGTKSLDKDKGKDRAANRHHRTRNNVPRK